MTVAFRARAKETVQECPQQLCHPERKHRILAIHASRRLASTVAGDPLAFQDRPLNILA